MPSINPAISLSLSILAATGVTSAQKPLPLLVDIYSKKMAAFGLPSPGAYEGGTVTFAYAERDFAAPGRTDSENWYVKLGHRWGAGQNNRIGIDYSETDDLAAAGDEATTWGVGFTHNIPGPRVELYAGYRNFDLDRPGVNIEDVDTFNIGSRIRF